MIFSMFAIVFFVFYKMLLLYVVARVFCELFNMVAMVFLVVFNMLLLYVFTMVF